MEWVAKRAIGHTTRFLRMRAWGRACPGAGVGALCGKCTTRGSITRAFRSCTQRVSGVNKQCTVVAGTEGFWERLDHRGECKLKQAPSPVYLGTCANGAKRVVQNTYGTKHKCSAAKGTARLYIAGAVAAAATLVRKEGCERMCGIHVARGGRQLYSRNVRVLEMHFMGGGDSFTCPRKARTAAQTWERLYTVCTVA